MKVRTAIGVVLVLGTALPAASAQRRESGDLSPEAVKTIQAAIASLDRERGADKRGGKSAGVSGNPGQFFAEDEYPPEAIRNGEQGRVIAKLAIGTDGRVKDCTVMQSSGSASLDSRTCAIALSKVVFTPATDERGRPIAASYTLPVRWILPVPPRWTFAAGSIIARLHIDGAGVVKGCTVEYVGSAPREDADPCLEFGASPPSVALTLRGGAGGLPRDTLLTIELMPGDLTTSTPVSDGSRVTAAAAMRITIDAAGQVTGCRPITATGYFAFGSSICSLMPGPFQPLASGTSVAECVATVVITITNPDLPMR